MRVIDLGTMAYCDAWAAQERAHAEVVGGAQEQLLLVEHPPVITFGRRPNLQRHLIASDDALRRLGVEVVQSDRGGEVTFHGPGQIVAYPIVRLGDHRLSVGAFVRRLEEIVIATLKEFGIPAQKDACAIGVWVPQEGAEPAKICALGVRIRRGVSMHGIALNVTTDLRYFDLIVPCGLRDRAVTSIQRVLGDGPVSIPPVRDALARHFCNAFQKRV